MIMFFKLIERILGRQLRSDSECDSQHTISDIHGNVVPDELLISAQPKRIQPYPSAVRKVPVLPPEHILSEMSELITETRRAASVPVINEQNYTFENLYMETIERFLGYVHLLPASRAWHHHNIGGLLYHSLDVGYRALRWANDNAVPRGGRTDEEVLRKPRYRFAAWVGGLAHDIGKAVTDITVIGDNGDVWDPSECSLIEWAERYKITTYNYEYKTTSKHKEHEIVAAEMLNYVLSDKARLFIKESPDELMLELKNTLRNYEYSRGYLASAIRTADVMSTQEDVEREQETAISQRSAALYEQCVKAMRTMILDWSINEPTGHAFNIGGTIYLKYPDCIDLIREKLLSIGLNVPNSTKNLLNVLSERGITQRDDEKADYSVLFIGEYTLGKIQQLAASSKPTKSIRVIKVTWPGYVFGSEVLPPSLNGLLKVNMDWDCILYNDGKSHKFSSEDVFETNTDKETQTESNPKKVTPKKKTKVQIPKNKPGTKNSISKQGDKPFDSDGNIKLVRKKVTSDNKPKINLGNDMPALNSNQQNKQINVNDGKSSTSLVTKTSTPSAEKTIPKKVIKHSTEHRQKIPNNKEVQLPASEKEAELCESQDLDTESVKHVNDILCATKNKIPNIPWAKGMLSKLELTIDSIVKNNETKYKYDDTLAIPVSELESALNKDKHDIALELVDKGYLHQDTNPRRPVTTHHERLVYVLNKSIAESYIPSIKKTDETIETSVQTSTDSKAQIETSNLNTSLKAKSKTSGLPVSNDVYVRQIENNFEVLKNELGIKKSDKPIPMYLIPELIAQDINRLGLNIDGEEFLRQTNSLKMPMPEVAPAKSDLEIHQRIIERTGGKLIKYWKVRVSNE